MRGLFSIFLFCIFNGALAQHNPRPRLIPIGCNFDGGLAWLALGKAAAGPELESFQVEISDVDLESVEATIYFVFLFHPDRVFATWLNLVHSRAKQ